MPIYWLNGAKAADDYEDFYDGSWDTGNAARNESGARNTVVRVWTGTAANGTRSNARMGVSCVARGWPNGTSSPITGSCTSSHGANPLYGLSPVITVQAPTDTTAPSLADTAPAVVNGATLTLTFDEALDTAHDPGKDAFTVEADDTDIDVTAASLSGSTVTLTLASAVTAGQTVEVSYTKPSAEANQLQDTAGNKVQAFSDQAVTNNTKGIVYTGTFAEAAANDGSVAGSVTATLSGDTFTAGVATGSNVTMTNVPMGLTADYALNDDRTVFTLTLTGMANAHAHANDVSNIGIAFADGAFTGGSASAVSGSSKSDIAIDFADDIAVSVSTETTEITEGDTATIEVTASAAPASDLTINYSVAGGGNFGVSAGSKTVVLSAGETTVDIEIATRDDTTEERDQRIRFQVSAGTGYTVEGVTVILVTVRDDETAPPRPSAPRHCRRSTARR